MRSYNDMYGVRSLNAARICDTAVHQLYFAKNNYVTESRRINCYACYKID